MIPSTWRPYRRGSDDELVGYLDGDDPSVTPRTLFGYPLASAGPAAAAVRLLEKRGLVCLAERWSLRLDSTEQVDVMIMAAFPDWIEVVETEYGSYGPDSPRHRLSVPTGDRLTR
ncbi:MAG: hypothetical protein L0H41_01795 [Microlunatus sp.]|nr:hypothetical protein [Microlunatus sp.]MDN5769651.1 hypothetical protein [Microlunatus sp.]MDN5803540.1 hypothetical protein [Microlunatus sp.]